VNVTMLVLLIVLGVVVVAACVTALVFFILFLVKLLGGTTGGWRRLTEVYPTSKPPRGQTVTGQTVQIGAVTYKRCVTLGIADEGLYVTIWRKTVLIHWTVLKRIGEATLYWQKVPMLTISDPPVATMTVPVAVFQMMRGRFPATLVGADGEAS
jgi:hypothetical protein